jgi:hypothetical protein
MVGTITMALKTTGAEVATAEVEDEASTKDILETVEIVEVAVEATAVTSGVDSPLGMLHL